MKIIRLANTDQVREYLTRQYIGFSIRMDQNPEEPIDHEQKAEEFANDIIGEIEGIGVPFEITPMKGAAGFADNEKLYINSLVLNQQLDMFLFIFFHELTHYHQYKKYGNDFVLPLYTNDEASFEEGMEALIQIENTANRMAEMKGSHYLRKYEIPLTMPSIDIGEPMYRPQITEMFRKFREIVAELPKDQQTIQKVNEALFNYIK